MATGELTTALSFASSGWQVDLNVTQFVGRQLSDARRNVDRPRHAAFLSQRDARSAPNASGVPASAYTSTTPLPSWTWDSRAQTLWLSRWLQAASLPWRAAAPRYSSRVRTRRLHPVQLLLGAADPMLAAYLTLQRALYEGGYASLAAGRAAWGEVWRGRPLVSGPGFTREDQRSLDGAHFYLTAHPRVGRACRHTGSQPGTCYFGGIFWDMDSWMVQPVSHTSAAAGLPSRDSARARSPSPRKSPRSTATLG